MKNQGKWLAISMVALSPSSYSAEILNSFDTLASLSLTELAQVKVRESGALTSSSLRSTPAAITRLDADDIESSGARNLLELLDIYVPNVQWIRHNWEPNHLGARGITSDREDKIMIRVNGRVMNEHTHIGAITERDFPMMADIQTIDVIRGAGSSMYGLGAVAMVIDIKTHDTSSEEGSGVVAKAGAVYGFSSLEGFHRDQFGDGVDLYVYGAIGKVNGADEDDAPIIHSVDYTSQTGQYVPAGSAYPDREANDGSQYKDRPPVKLHMQFQLDEHELWLRYTRGGERTVRDLGLLAAPGPGWGFPYMPDAFAEMGYQQFTATYEHQYSSGSEWNVDSMVSFDSLDYQRLLPFPGGFYAENYREDEWFAKSVATWQPNATNELALGAEFSHEEFGLSPHRNDDDVAITGSLESWSTNTASLLGEWQWQVADDWTAFLGGRLDKNTYSDALFSPRLSVIWFVNQLDALKLLLTRSQRMSFAEHNRLEYLSYGENSDPEVLDSAELRWERFQDEWHVALSAFYLELDVIGWNAGTGECDLIGTQKQMGLEFELERKVRDFVLLFSHGWTKLRSFDLEAEGTLITAEPLGFGDDLADWSNHISKLVVRWQASDKWELNSSLRVYWGFPGSSDMRDYWVSVGATDRVSADWDQPYEEQVFLNLGSQYRPNPQTKIGLNLYNVLGWVDKDYNKRTFRDSWGNYRSEAAAAALSVSFTW